MPKIPDQINSEDEHFFRNNINIEYSWGILQQLTSTHIPEAIRWKQTDKTDAALHQHHTNGGDNTKWISGDGHFEIVYSAQHTIQNASNNPEDMGTYNFHTLTDASGHTNLDVVTWLKYGNASNDTTTKADRVGDLIAAAPGKVVATIFG